MPFPTGHALLIGIGNYAHAPQLNVPITAADAQAVATVLGDPHYCGYPADQVTLLANATASREGILAALDALVARVSADDTVFLFFCGHGDYGDDGDYYLTTHDTRFADQKVVSGSGVRQEELIAKLKALNAKRLLLVINACHSGELSPVLGPGETPYTGAPLPAPTAAALLGTGEGRIIITACRDDQVSYIGRGNLTLFTKALVSGLQGKDGLSKNGYISAFDLYTHLYYTVSQEVQAQFGATQEPELTILKGVGPFAVALRRGATTLGTFDAPAVLPEGMAVRQVNPAYSQAMLRQHNQQISGNAQVGTAIAGDVHGDVHVNQQTDQSQRGVAKFGSGGRFGDIKIGDIAGRDIIRTKITQGDRITTGDISGSGIAIGRGAQSSVRNVDTGGGDYAEGNIDKKQGTFVTGDQFNMSGNFSGAILGIQSTLSNISQNIGAAPHGDTATKAQLQDLIAQLSAELQKMPAAQASEAEAVAETAKSAIEQATKAQPNRTMVKISVEGLKKAAENIAAVLPKVLPLSQQIAEKIQALLR